MIDKETKLCDDAEPDWLLFKKFVVGSNGKFGWFIICDWGIIDCWLTE